MRRLRFAVQVFTDAHIPLGPDGLSERRHRSGMMIQDPDLFMLVAAMPCGGSWRPSPALQTRSGGNCSTRCSLPAPSDENVRPIAGDASIANLPETQRRDRRNVEPRSSSWCRELWRHEQVGCPPTDARSVPLGRL